MSSHILVALPRSTPHGASGGMMTRALQPSSRPHSSCPCSLRKGGCMSHCPLTRSQRFHALSTRSIASTTEAMAVDAAIAHHAHTKVNAHAECLFWEPHDVTFATAPKTPCKMRCSGSFACSPSGVQHQFNQ
eukprot:5508227-Amphidinium_carterae.1